MSLLVAGLIIIGVLLLLPLAAFTISEGMTWLNDHGKYRWICRKIAFTHRHPDSEKGKVLFYKQVSWFKWILSHESEVKVFIDDLILADRNRISKEYNNPFVVDDCERLYAKEVWKLRAHRHLFTPAELKTIHAISDRIFLANCDYEVTLRQRKESQDRINAAKTQTKQASQAAPVHKKHCPKERM